MSDQFKFSPVDTIPAGRGGRLSACDPLVKAFAAGSVNQAKLEQVNGKDLSDANVRSSVVGTINKAAKRLSLPVQASNRDGAVYLVKRGTEASEA